jgi:hypothetical protein
MEVGRCFGKERNNLHWLIFPSQKTILPKEKIRCMHVLKLVILISDR